MKVLVTFEVDTDEAGALPRQVGGDVDGSNAPSVIAIQSVTEWWRAWIQETARAKLTPHLVAVEARP